jgi:hypothetical protein
MRQRSNPFVAMIGPEALKDSAPHFSVCWERTNERQANQNITDRQKQIFNFSRKNYGVTPAYDVSIVEFGEAIIERGQPVPALGPPPDDIRGTITLFPTAELPFRLTEIFAQIGQDKIERMIRGDDMQFVYFGTIQYHDIFMKRQFTYFCWMYTLKGTTAKDAEGCLGRNDST